ncbi:MAG: saccharopine dehydrogenase NADP-binding domain-containing protein [Candidatus Delongbacteria bacterium]|jgi:saccharopine dehydrogenase (NADP+, L-glutamate forming)|nr:saccharopine dehydrogenase NADP-binding domain-containing protein [Candidatus Delongbacteria bacterium]
MKKVLILGAGMVSKPMFEYLLKKEIQITVASNTPENSEKVIGNNPLGKSIYLDIVEDKELMEKLISEHDLTVSLLPYAFHVEVAKLCIKHKKNMVTTSYVKPEMHDLDQQAKDAGIIILNELGVDPGIDHMSAMRIIDHIHDKGGKVEEFYSITGAIVAPEVEKNPFNYKFTWAPKGVVMAGNNDGKFLWKGKEKYVPTEDLFKDPFSINFPDVGKLFVYPNRDSLPYIDLYGIPEAKSIFRGTFRYDRWCENLDAMKKCDLLSYDKMNLSGKSYADLLAVKIGADNSEDIRNKTADFLNISAENRILDAFEWVGLFSDNSIGKEEDSPFEVVSDIMIAKMIVGETERDMVAMQHTFLASYPDGKREVIKSRLLDFGSLQTDTSIARTVALPAAVGVRMILEGKIVVKGVHIPVIPNIYNSILDALEEMDIKMIEEYGLPESENIQ